MSFVKMILKKVRNRLIVAGNRKERDQVMMRLEINIDLYEYKDSTPAIITGVLPKVIMCPIVFMSRIYGLVTPN